MSTSENNSHLSAVYTFSYNLHQLCYGFRVFICLVPGKSRMWVHKEILPKACDVTGKEPNVCFFCTDPTLNGNVLFGRERSFVVGKHCFKFGCFEYLSLNNPNPMANHVWTKPGERTHPK